MKLFHFLTFLLFGGIFADDSLEDVQTEFYLPYSVTEDVDFSLSKPSGFGCYQWSTDEEDAVALAPIFTDYDNMCGSRLEFKVIKNNGKPNIDFKITAENVDMSSGYDNTDVPMVVEYTIHVRPVAKLEVLGLKTELTAGSDPVPFGVAGYDEEENEFDTLDGLQLTWYIGSKREIANFENFRTMGPIVKVQPVGTGTGAVIAILTDPNYEKVEPAFMEFSVKANLFIEPDGAYLLEGATAKLQLFEQSGILDSNGKPTKVEIETTGKDPDFTFEVKEPEYATVDKETNVITAMQLGETTVFVKNAAGEIVKGMPIRIAKANKIKIVAEPEPSSNQLIKGNDYTLKVKIFTKEDRPIYPSENILCKTTFPKHLEVIEVTENGLEAKVNAKANGLGKVKANLRSVLDPEDEELEIIPHVKGSTDFEIYDQITIKPTFTLLPWDDNVKPNYTLSYKAEGGGQVYTWTSDLETVTLGKPREVPKEAMVSNDNEGVFHTTATGPVSFNVKASSPKSADNFDEAQVHILPATHLELTTNSEEFSTSGLWRGNVKFFTLLPKTNEKVMFTDCANIPYEIKLSDPENFYVDDRSRSGAVGINHCAHFSIKAKKSGLSTKVTVSYLEPSSGRTLRSHMTISSYKSLVVLHPGREKNTEPKHTLLLPIGSTGKIVLQGGPQPWPEKQLHHSKHIQVEDATIAKVTEHRIDQDSTDYIDEHIYDVTCLAEGKTEVAFNIGNTKTDSVKVALEEKLIDVECAMPQKLMFKYNHVDEESKIVVNRKTNRVMANKDKDVKLTFTLKDKRGKTFTNVDSLNIQTKVSDNSLLVQETTHAVIPNTKLTQYAHIPGKPEHVLKVKGNKGDVEIKFKLAGYNEEVLAKAGVTNPPALPKVIDEEDMEDMDYEDEEAFSMHGHALMDELELHLASGEDIEKVPTP